MTNDILEKAVKLSSMGLPVFPVRLDPATGTKTPLTKHGHLDASVDPGLIEDWFTETPGAQVGVYVGAASLVALDLDEKNGKSGSDALDRAWLPVPDTYQYDTPSGGKHLIYRAPDDVDLAPSSNYRGMKGVDIRGGSSWVLWNGAVPDTGEVFTSAPDWMLDPVKVRSYDAFEGDVEDWFLGLVPGKPNSVVQKAIDRVSDDMSHSDMIASQHHAIRLGAEGNPGVTDLLARLESAWLARPSENHTTPEDEWEFKFAEGLSSGVGKAGETIQILRDAPDWSLTLVPDSISDSLVMGTPGDRTSFSKLLNALVNTLPPEQDSTVFSILWNSPVTKEVSREWGAEFTYKRVQEARNRPEPERENPSLERQEQVSETHGTSLLSPLEREQVESNPTFIDAYLEASQGSKGFVNEYYEVPLAWTALSMAVGFAAVIPRNGTIGINLWFNVMGYSGTGKTKSLEFGRAVLDKLFHGQESYYNLGGNSSPDGLHDALLVRDKLSSVFLEDEASGFFQNLVVKDWMGSLTHAASDWYTGWVPPSNKVRLKELKGVSANTSFNICMVSTPDKTVRLLTDEMFETGFLSRMSWVWAPPATDNSHRYQSTRASVTESGIPTQVKSSAFDLAGLSLMFEGDEERTVVWGSDWAVGRLDQAYEDMDRRARTHPKYGVTLEPSITRLAETLWKCSALIALYRGDDQFQLADALAAVYHVEHWYETLFRVSDAVTGAFKRDCDEITEFLAVEGGSSSRARVMDRFVGMITKSKRDIEDRIDYLVDSGRINRYSDKQQVRYELNGGNA